jgi:hypothetical protein
MQAASYAVALSITLLAELPLAFVLGFRGRKTLLCIALVNIITNPAANWFWSLFAYFGQATIWAVLVIESVVVVVEWKFLEYITETKSATLLLASLAMNATSFTVGVLLFW